MNYQNINQTDAAKALLYHSAKRIIFDDQEIFEDEVTECIDGETLFYDLEEVAERFEVGYETMEHLSSADIHAVLEDVRQEWTDAMNEPFDDPAMDYARSEMASMA